MSERRQHPRIPVHFEAQLLGEPGKTMPCQIGNISPGGVMVKADLALKGLLLNHDQEMHNLIQSPVEASFKLQLYPDRLPLKLHCRLCHVIRQSYNCYEFGFRFLDLDDDAEQQLEQFVANPYARTGNCPD